MARRISTPARSLAVQVVAESKIHARVARPITPVGPTPGIRRAAVFLKNASNLTRIQILWLLGEQERTVAAIYSDMAGQAEVSIGRHLTVLRNNRMIKATRSGSYRIYGLTEDGRDLVRIIDSIGDSGRMR